MGREAAAVGRRPQSLLALGNPAVGGGGSAGIPGPHQQGDFTALPEAEAEAREVGRFFGDGRKEILTGARATEAAVKSLAPGYGTIHFAAHGVLDNLHPFYSYLMLSTSESGDDGLLEAREIMNLDLSADLVVLSSCETARGKVSAGEGVIGMSWAFFAAGCRTVVASQWKVSSGGTSRLMVNFYRALGSTPRTKGKAEALREAALSLMKNTRYRHPFYWAGFVLVGRND